MGRILSLEDMKLELLDDDTWKLLEIYGDTQMPEFVEGKPITVIGSLAFEYKSTLKDIIVSEGVVKIEKQGLMSRHMTSCHLPSTVREVDGKALFYAIMLESIQVSEDNPYFFSQDGIMFSKDGSRIVKVPSAKNMANYQIPSSVKVIGSNAFAECWKMEELVIPGNVRCIEDNAFRECEHLHWLHIEEGLEHIEPEAFDGCYQLQKFWFPDSLTDFGEDSFFGAPAMVAHLRLPSWMEEVPSWFSAFDRFSLKLLECEGMSIYDVPKNYRDAVVRFMALQYFEGVEVDPYELEDCLVYAGDRRNAFFSEMMENESLLYLLLNRKIVTEREAIDLAAKASKMGKLEVTAQFTRYAQEKGGAAGNSLGSLEL